MYVGMYNLYNSLKTFSNYDLNTGLIGQKYKSKFNQNKTDLQAPFFHSLICFKSMRSIESISKKNLIVHYLKETTIQYSILTNSIIADSISALRDYGITGLWDYGFTALRLYGFTAFRHFGITALRLTAIMAKNTAML